MGPSHRRGQRQPVAAEKLRAAVRDNRPTADWMRADKARPAAGSSGGVQSTESTRHYVEVEHWSYRKAVQRLAHKLG